MEYALGVVSLVRAPVERREGRTVGTAGVTWKRSVRFRVVVATLLREGSPQRDSRQLIQRKPLLKVKMGLRLKEYGVDRVELAVACCAWLEE